MSLTFSRWASVLAPALLGLALTWTCAPAAEPDWKAQVLPHFCRSYTTVVTQAARARQAGIPRETVLQTVTAGHLQASPLALGTLRTHLAAINAVYRGRVQTPAQWETTAQRVCLASGLNESQLLH